MLAPSLGSVVCLVLERELPSELALLIMEGSFC